MATTPAHHPALSESLTSPEDDPLRLLSRQPPPQTARLPTSGAAALVTRSAALPPEVPARRRACRRMIPRLALAAFCRQRCSAMDGRRRRARPCPTGTSPTRCTCSSPCCSSPPSLRQTCRRALPRGGTSPSSVAAFVQIPRPARGLLRRRGSRDPVDRPDAPHAKSCSVRRGRPDEAASPRSSSRHQRHPAARPARLAGFLRYRLLLAPAAGHPGPRRQARRGGRLRGFAGRTPPDGVRVAVSAAESRRRRDPRPRSRTATGSRSFEVQMPKPGFRPVGWPTRYAGWERTFDARQLPPSIPAQCPGV
jgi:hypothetical protein